MREREREREREKVETKKKGSSRERVSPRRRSKGILRGRERKKPLFSPPPSLSLFPPTHREGRSSQKRACWRRGGGETRGLFLRSQSATIGVSWKKKREVNSFVEPLFFFPLLARRELRPEYREEGALSRSSLPLWFLLQTLFSLPSKTLSLSFEPRRCRPLRLSACRGTRWSRGRARRGQARVSPKKRRRRRQRIMPTTSTTTRPPLLPLLLLRRPAEQSRPWST